MPVDEAALTIDLNFDGGEGCDDAALMPLVSSVNVACGGHTGDEDSMRAAVRLARKHGVAVNAHPSYPDRETFGRGRPDVPPVEVARFVEEQVLALIGVLQKEGMELSGVKPHGGLYHASSKSSEVAEALIEGVELAVLTLRNTGRGLVFVSSPGSALLQAARERRWRSAAEGFADRSYEPDGSLVPRSESDALVTDPWQAARQALAIVKDGTVATRDGRRLPLAVETLCVHGDTPGAPAIAAAVRRALDAAGIGVAPLAIH